MTLTENYTHPTVPDALRERFERLADTAEELLPRIEQFVADSLAARHRFGLLGWGDDAAADQAFEAAIEDSGSGRVQALHSWMACLLYWSNPMGGPPSANYIESHGIESPTFWSLYHEWDRLERRFAGREDDK